MRNVNDGHKHSYVYKGYVGGTMAWRCVSCDCKYVEKWKPKSCTHPLLEIDKKLRGSYE